MSSLSGLFCLAKQDGNLSRQESVYQLDSSFQLQSLCEIEYCVIPSWWLFGGWVQLLLPNGLVWLPTLTMIKKPFWRIPADLFGHFFFRIFKWKKNKKPVRHPDTQSKTSMTGCNTHLSSNHYHMLQKSTVVYCWPHLCSSSLLTETLFFFFFFKWWNWFHFSLKLVGKWKADHRLSI